MKDGGWAKGINSFKTCSICKNLFIVRKNAKTADTRNVCFKCRQELKKTQKELRS